MKITNLLCGTLFAALAAFSVTADAQASMVTVLKDIMVAPNVNSGANDGGLDFDVNTESANGSDVLTFRLFVDDSAGTSGATFSANVSLSTADVDGTIFSNVAGRIVMGTQVSSLTGFLNNFVQVTGTPGATLTFDGFSEVNADQWTLATDTLAIGGASYAGDSSTMPLNLSANLGLTFDATGSNQWRIGTFTSQFTATPTAVPEPSSLALLGLVGAVGTMRRKRANRS